MVRQTLSALLVTALTKTLYKFHPDMCLTGLHGDTRKYGSVNRLVPSISTGPASASAQDQHLL